MKNSIFAALTLFAMAANFAAPSLAGSLRESAAATSELVSLLPASDAVVTIDAGRFFGEAMPTVLSGNPTLLGKVTAEIDKMKAETGIDVRKFSSIAAGVNIRKGVGKNFDFDPVVVARGQVDAAALVSAAKVAANGKIREEKMGTRTIYVFSPREVAKQQNAAGKGVDRVAGKLSEEIAVTAYDTNTVVGGSAARVRELISAKSRISADLTSYLGRTPGSLMDFAANVPNGMSTLLPLENDELGKNVDAIRLMYGSMSVAGDTTSVTTTARTLQPEQAKGLKETLDGLQMIGKAFLGSAKGADKQVYARMIENVRFAQAGNEVSMSLNVPQSDLNVLLAMIK